MTTLLNQIRKEFGEQSIFILGQDERLMDIKVRSSGSLLLDLALGGGFPCGKLVEFAGKEKSGKTTLLNLFIAQAQRDEPDKKCAIIDLEHTYNPKWAEVLGVDLNRLYFSQPDTYAEKILEMVHYLVKTGEFSVIGLDSVAGLIPKEEFEQDDYEKESRVGGTSKLNAKLIRKVINSGDLTKSGTTLVFINQLRDKIGAFSPYGTPTETPGGRSLKHAYAQQLDLSTGEYFTKGSGQSKEIVGQQIRIRVSKNKIAPPFRTASIDLYYENGVDKLMELVLVAKELGILQGSSWLKLIDPETGEIVTTETGEEIKFHGVGKAREALVDDIQNNGGKLYSLLYNIVQELIRG